MSIVKIAHNAVVAKIVDPERDIALQVSDLLSYTVEGFEHMTKRPGWDGRSSFYNFKDHTFPSGFINRVRQRLMKEGHQVKIIRKPLPECLGPETPTVDSFGFDPKYDYQMKTVRQLEKFGMIIAQLATGAGKSRVGRLAYKRVGRKTLFLTTRGSLMYQFRDACLESFGEKEIGIVGDSVWQSDRPLVCGMVQTLAARLEIQTEEKIIDKLLKSQSDKFTKERDNLQKNQVKLKVKVGQRRLELEALKTRQLGESLTDDHIAKVVDARLKKSNKQRKETLDLLRQFEFVIAEEAHEAGGNGYFDVMQACSNAHYRLALTATPFMRGDAESNMRLMAVSGGIGIKVTEKELIDKGILAKPIFKIVPTKKPDKLFRGSSYTKAYDVGIVNNEWRNRYIAAECIRMARYGLTTMILVQRKAHGDNIIEILNKVGLKSKFIKGENDQNDRKRALSMLNTGEISVLLGTNILDVGVDVPSVGCIVLAGGGKAEVANRQRIGRGLRAKKDGPNICFVLDFADEHNSHLQKHAIQRRAIITGTAGFSENLIEKDWDITDYGFKRSR